MNICSHISTTPRLEVAVALDCVNLGDSSGIWAVVPMAQIVMRYTRLNLVKVSRS